MRIVHTVYVIMTIETIHCSTLGKCKCADKAWSQLRHRLVYICLSSVSTLNLKLSQPQSQRLILSLCDVGISLRSKER